MLELKELLSALFFKLKIKSDQPPKKESALQRSPRVPGSWDSHCKGPGVFSEPTRRPLCREYKHERERSMGGNLSFFQLLSETVSQRINFVNLVKVEKKKRHPNPWHCYITVQYKSHLQSLKPRLKRTSEINRRLLCCVVLSPCYCPSFMSTWPARTITSFCDPCGINTTDFLSL